MQREALNRSGCKTIFEDHGVSGIAVERKGLSEALEKVGEEDVLVVWKLDRLGRSLGHLIEVINGLGEKGVGFASLSESIDTTTAGGKLVFHMMGALAEFERSLISERTKAGMRSARNRGKHICRPRKLTTAQISHARDMIETGKQTRAGMANLYGVDPATFWRALRETRMQA